MDALPPVQRPTLHSIPIFEALRVRGDLTHIELMLYGAIAAYKQVGYEPTYPDLAFIGHDLQPECRPTRARLRNLERAGLIARQSVPRTGSRRPLIVFRLLGPRIEAPTQAPHVSAA